MDTGKIFLGIALIAFSVAMVINPANAAVGDTSCSVGNGNGHFPDGIIADGSPQDTAQPGYPAAPVTCQLSTGMLPLMSRKESPLQCHAPVRTMNAPCELVKKPLHQERD